MNIVCLWSLSGSVQCRRCIQLLHEVSKFRRELPFWHRKTFFTKKLCPATGFVLDTQDERARLKKKLDEAGIRLESTSGTSLAQLST